MKLHGFSVQGFGVLQDRSWDFKGESHVVLGLNEEGKTTFIDALIAALYGKPRINPKLDLFGLRYDRGRCRAEALLKEASGNDLPSASDKGRAAGEKWLPEALFRSLFVVRGGECPLEGSADMISAFTDRVLGGGTVNLDGAKALTERIASTNKNSPWFKALGECEKRVLALQSGVAKADEQAALQKSIGELTAEAADAEKAIKAAEAEIDALRASSKEAELERLKALRGELESCAGRAAKQAGLDRGGLSALEELDLRIKAVEGSQATLASQMQTAQRDLERAKTEQEEQRQALRKLGESQAAQAMSEALERFSRLEAAGSGGELPPLWRGVVAALAGLAAGALAFHFLGIGASLLCGASLAALAWSGLGLLSKQDGPNLDAARHELDILAQTMGPDWKGLGVAQMRERVNGRTAAATAGQSGMDQAQALMDRKAAELAGYRADQDKAETEIAGLRRRLSDGLRACGADTLKQAADKIAAHEQDQVLLAKLLAEAEKCLDRKPADARDADAALSARIRQLEDEAAALPADAPKLKPGELSAKLKRKESALFGMKASLRGLCERLNHAKIEDAAMTAQLGRRPAELFADLQREQRRLEDFRLWREAACAAGEEIAKLADDTSRGLEECLAKAAPLFEAMSGGRYTAVSGEDVFDQAALQVRHESQGDKPLPWMSSGAQDMLWLALRMALAGKALPEPGFLLLDEPCLHLDMSRAAAAVEALLKHPSMSGWQIIILTKDDRVADTCAKAGAKRAGLSAA